MFLYVFVVNVCVFIIVPNRRHPKVSSHGEALDSVGLDSWIRSLASHGLRRCDAGHTQRPVGT